ncbi:hypothetical protein AXY_08770 [Amphibacillus xylanus NBRC 15112]|uniref:Uncharacterized protein n=1 Tax=Amphibacillus xylanus (strain ATCC 51415 / DSM 6626 / JCM 7361 / LMG 17667 / NBRC 15112 / Ep01) TaxID=698758 RepID=K0IX90_AMPXN|nr:hypothetical protein AXY_08770 [Amphibacillus xylanus NBRC 15112]
MRGGLYTADYKLVETDQIYLKTKAEVEMRSLTELMENDLFEAIKDLNAHLN